MFLDGGFSEVFLRRLDRLYETLESVQSQSQTTTTADRPQLQAGGGGGGVGRGGGGEGQQDEKAEEARGEAAAGVGKAAVASFDRFESSGGSSRSYGNTSAVRTYHCDVDGSIAQTLQPVVCEALALQLQRANNEDRSGREEGDSPEKREEGDSAEKSEDCGCEEEAALSASCIMQHHISMGV